MHRSPEVSVIHRNYHVDVSIGTFENFHFNLGLRVEKSFRP